MKLWDSQYKTLNHWRGIAALWVVAFHSFAAYDNPLYPFHPIVQFIQGFSAEGYLGVNLFFVISGYCIAASIYKLSSRNGSSWGFITSRMWRIYPTYWAAFLLAIIINLVSCAFNGTSIGSNLPPSWQSWLGHIFLLQPYLNVDFYVGVYWTLVVEVAFYVTVAILLIIRNHAGDKLALSIGLILAFISAFFSLETKFKFIPYWCEFLCGFLVFTALVSKHQNRRKYHKISIFLIVIFALLGIWINYNLKPTTLWFSAVFAMALYLLHSFDHKISSIPQLNWLNYLGIMSYSLYLVHVPFQAKILNLGFRIIPRDSPIILVLQIFCCVIIISASLIFYRLVEKPINNWRHQQNKLHNSKKK